MLESWESLVDMSIVHFMIYPETVGGDGPVLETVSKIVNDDFFSMIEVTHINGPEVRKQVADLIRTAHMRVGFGAQPVILSQKLNLNSLDSGKRKEAVSKIETLVDEAREIGASRLAVLSGPDPGDKGRDEAKNRLIDSLLEICSYAKEKSVSIALETFDRSVDKKSLIGPSQEALEVSKTIKGKFNDFGLMYDMGHAPLLEEDFYKALSLLKGHLVHIHVGNCVRTQGHPAYGDQHPRFGLPGGSNDVTELVQFLRALRKVGYIRSTPQEVSPVVGFELKPRPGETSEAVIANGKRAWKKAWSLL
jgi:sugar phosphate isomerase/epimerase